ncbi:MAG TPA: sigma-70 family RNA polymerase sigma factor [Streptosporangiaceae bacterium]|nr:sigma-70 family RNA polymerase sigma factor [Streptosporangiaceae bacterium]
MGGGHAGGHPLFGRGPRDRRYRGRAHRERALRPDLEELLRRCWWGAMAEVARATGRLDVAEDSVQDACVVAVQQWAADKVPRDPQAWLTGVARHKALDRLRRESRRPAKEATGAAEAAGPAGGSAGPARSADEDLWLIYLCCHPALSPEARIALTLRAVGGLTTAEIAAAFLVPEATMAKRLTRAKNKIRDAGLVLAMPQTDLLKTRTADVLRVVYLIFSEGHQASSGDDLLRPDLCVAGVNLARGLAARRPRDPEVLGLLALLLLTDARRAARTDGTGDLVLLEEQDRTRWDQAMIADGEGLLVEALRMGQPGPYQLWAAIAACHSTAASAAATDWRQISVLYGELLKYDPSPVTEANRAVAVAMAEGPAAGLTILDVVLGHPQLATWPRIHVARADLLARMGRGEEAARAYRTALELEPPAAERRYIQRRLAARDPD